MYVCVCVYPMYQMYCPPRLLNNINGSSGSQCLEGGSSAGGSLVDVCGGGGRSRGANEREGRGERKQVLSSAVTPPSSVTGWGLSHGLDLKTEEYLEAANSRKLSADCIPYH